MSQELDFSAFFGGQIIHYHISPDKTRGYFLVRHDTFTAAGRPLVTFYMLTAAETTNSMGRFLNDAQYWNLRATTSLQLFEDDFVAFAGGLPGHNPEDLSKVITKFTVGGGNP